MHVIISDIEQSLGVIFVCNYYIKKFQTFLPSACVPYYDHNVVCVSFHFYIPPYIINFSDYNEIEQFCVPPVVSIVIYMLVFWKKNLEIQLISYSG
jgi:hypothetical protein